MENIKKKKTRLKNIMFDETSEKSARFYTKMMGWLDSPWRYQFNNPQRLLEAAGIKSGQTVLEIGCGSGFFTIPVAKMLGENGRLYAIDIHPIAVRETKEKVEALKLHQVTVQKEDAMHSTFEDNMFDVVLLYGVVPAPVICMKDISKEINRILKPGGTYAIWTLAPLFRPVQAVKYAGFAKWKKKKGVFNLTKKK